MNDDKWFKGAGLTIALMAIGWMVFLVWFLVKVLGIIEGALA